MDSLTITYLHRIDTTKNMARFYEVSIEDTLFGPAVRRRWGRIGSRVGQSKMEFCDSDEEAGEMMKRFAAAKIRRGYSFGESS